MNNRRLTGSLLIAVPLLFTAIFTALQLSFEYPAILRQDTAYILERFQAGGWGLIALWYGMFLSALAFIPIAILVARVWSVDTLILRFSLVFGVLAGLVQALGFLRWVILVPSLASSYLEAGASAAQKDALAVVFQAFHQYLGMGVGEHLGYLFTALWTITIALFVFKRSPLLSWTGVIFATGIMSGMLEPLGLAQVGVINAVSYLLWSLWMMALGIHVLRSNHTEVRTNLPNIDKMTVET